MSRVARVSKESRETRVSRERFRLIKDGHLPSERGKET